MPFSTEAAKWIERSSHHVGTIAGSALASDTDYEALIKRLFKRADGKQVYRELVATAKADGASPAVVAEFDRLGQRAERFRQILTPADEKSLVKVAGVMRTAREARPVYKALFDAVAAGQLSADVATGVAHRAAAAYGSRLNATIPWYCIVCYTIPLIGLVCIFSSTCRGEGLAMAPD